MAELSRDDLKRLARLGAMRRLEELRREEATIRAAFPELFRASSRAARGPAGDRGRPTRKRRRKSKLSPEARKAVSERMTKYWADWRKANKAKAKRG